MTNEGTSNYFSCNVGVRQGENLSPFLFSIFLNDLETHLRTNGVAGISFFKILILLYADDSYL